MEILKDKTPIARKEHRCEYCGEMIHVGEKYNRPMFMTAVFMIG